MSIFEIQYPVAETDTCQPMCDKHAGPLPCQPVNLPVKLHFGNGIQRCPPMEKYNDLENLFWQATQSRAAAYRKQFKIAADACGIKYFVSTHSTWKSFGHWSVKIYPYDVITVDPSFAQKRNSKCCAKAAIKIFAKNKKTLVCERML